MVLAGPVLFREDLGSHQKVLEVLVDGTVEGRGDWHELDEVFEGKEGGDLEEDVWDLKGGRDGVHAGGQLGVERVFLSRLNEI